MSTPELSPGSMRVRLVAAWSSADRALWVRTPVIAVLALANFLFIPLDLAIGGDAPEWAIAGRTLFAVAFVVGAVGLRPGRWLVTGGVVTGGLAGLALYALCRGTGGVDGEYFALYFALPLVLGAIGPTHLPLILSATATGALTGTLLLRAAGAGVPETIGWVSILAYVGGIATLGAVLYQRRVAAETEAVRERAAALDRLADSERRRAEAERLALVGRLAAGVAHEINNPLAFAATNIEYLRGAIAGGLTGDQRAALDETALGLERIRLIVRDLGAFARDRGDGPGACDVARALEESVRVASSRLASVARVERIVAPDLPPVKASHARLVQVFVNLLVNAADAIESVKRSGQGRVVVAAERAGERIRVRFDDDGPGLTPEVAARVFEPFLTTKPVGQGTGLGLAVSRAHVEASGGRLETGSSPLGGASFTVELALA